MSRPRKWRYLLLTVVIGVVLYLLAFLLATKTVNGIRSVVASGSVATQPVPARPIYISRTSKRLNMAGKAIFYPLITLGQASGWWEFFDDASGDYVDGPCLFLFYIGATFSSRCDAGMGMRDRSMGEHACSPSRQEVLLIDG